MDPATLDEWTALIVNAGSPTAPPAAREGVVALQNQLKSGDPRAAASVGAALAAPGRPLEAQHFGLQLLSALVAGPRWDEFGAADQKALADLALALLRQAAGGPPAASPAPWAVRSKAALLLALVAKRQGPALWAALVPELLAAAGWRGAGPAAPPPPGPPEAVEAASLTLRFAAEEVAVYSDDLAADARRALLAALAGTLPQVLAFFAAAVSGGVTAALTPGAPPATARSSAAAAKAALDAAAAHAEWAPLSDMAGAGLLAACGSLLSAPALADPAAAGGEGEALRLAALDVLKTAAGRKQGAEAPGPYDAAMGAVGGALASAADAVIAAPGAAEALGPDGDGEEVGARLAEACASFGGHHLHRLPGGRPAREGFLRTMLSFSRHPHLPLAGRALPMWVALLASAVGGPAAAAADGRYHAAAAAHHPRAASPPPAAPATPSDVAAAAAARDVIPLDCVAALMDLAGEQLRVGVGGGPGDRRPHAGGAGGASAGGGMLGASTAGGDELDEPPPGFDTAADYKAFLHDYRAGLSRLVRLAAALLPDAALAAAARRLGGALAAVAAAAPAAAAAAAAGQPLPPAASAAEADLEASVCFVEGVVTAVCGAHVPPSARPGGPAPPPPRAPPADGRSPSPAPAPAAPPPAAALDGMEALLRALVSSPAPATAGASSLHARALEAFGPLVAARPELAPLAGGRVFDLLAALPLPPGTDDASAASSIPAAARPVPPARPPPGWRAIVAARAAAAAAESDPADATQAGPGLGAVRGWLRQVREALYQVCGVLAGCGGGGVYGLGAPGGGAPSPGWAAALGGDALAFMEPRHVRLLERHVALPLVRGCPPDPASRSAWLAPVLAPLLPHTLAVLRGAWGAFTASASPSADGGGGGGGGCGGAARAEAEVVAERLMRELTQEHTALLKACVDRPPLPDGLAGAVQAVGSLPSPPPAHPGGAALPPHPAAPSALEFLLAASPDAATAAVLTAAAVLWWPDESVGRAAAVCRASIPLVSSYPPARALVAGDMLAGALAALGCAAAASAQAEALALVRDILVAELATPPPPGAPPPDGTARATLLSSLPRATPASVDALAARLGGTHSDRDQRAAVKKLLSAAGGDGLAAALADWRPSGATAGAAAAAAAASTGGSGSRRRRGRGGRPLEGLHE